MNANWRPWPWPTSGRGRPRLPWPPMAAAPPSAAAVVTRDRGPQRLASANAAVRGGPHARHPRPLLNGCSHASAAVGSWWKAMFGRRGRSKLPGLDSNLISRLTLLLKHMFQSGQSTMDCIWGTLFANSDCGSCVTQALDRSLCEFTTSEYTQHCTRFGSSQIENNHSIRKRSEHGN